MELVLRYRLNFMWNVCFLKHVVEDIRTDDIDGDAKNCQKPYVLNTTKGSRKILRPFFQSHMWFWIGRVKNGLYTCSYLFLKKTYDTKSICFIPCIGWRCWTLKQKLKPRQCKIRKSINLAKIEIQAVSEDSLDFYDFIEN